MTVDQAIFNYQSIEVSFAKYRLEHCCSIIGECNRWLASNSRANRYRIAIYQVRRDFAAQEVGKLHAQLAEFTQQGKEK